MLAVDLAPAQRANGRHQHADHAADDHRLAQQVVPATHRREQQHRAADHQRRKGDGARQSRDVAAEAGSQRLQPWQSAEVALGNPVQDTSRVAGCIAESWRKSDVSATDQGTQPL